ncbi:hypothetical protein GSI_12508 [Ganoderma sinense ZZ0214-1]|uniref:DUF6533 domain-containing protein n=1 Tax=Ganoderma sinense ZZ0214-1 TaxID=1077348 RepID=A0A2G8RT14_9APHY|nr:hypothetical protein GSI_12508 [Ganoderma sinense ZZ0214-1]
MDPSTIITVLSSFQISHTIGFSALAFLIFDHLLTFIEEVDLFWKPKLTGAAVIFFLNRYIVLSTAFFNNFGFSLVVSPKVHFAFGANGQYDTVFGCIIVDPIDLVLSQRCAYHSRNSNLLLPQLVFFK